MRINIYQIDGEKDTNRVKFSGYDETMNHGGIDRYRCFDPRRAVCLV